MMGARSISRSGRGLRWLRIALLFVGIIALLVLVGLVSAQESPRISGVAEFPANDECTEVEALGADFANVMTGDLKGCLYVFVDHDSISETPSGVYIERGTELYIGSGQDGDEGSFSTTYIFTAKFDENGQQFGRCHHPIVAGSGTGDYEGVRGRLDFEDNVVDGEAINFPYTGHLTYGG